MAKTFLIKDGDWVVDQATGRPIMIDGKSKTRQDLGEILSIEVQDNGWGAGILDLIGEVPDSPASVAFTVMERVRDAVNRWMGLQRRQRAALTSDEVIVDLSYNQAVVDVTDPTKVVFRVGVTTRTGAEIARGGTIGR